MTEKHGVVFVENVEWSESVKGCLERWGIDGLAASKFRIPFVSQADESDTQCIERFLQSPVVKDWFAARSGQTADTEAKLHLLKTTAISMSLFDAVKEGGDILLSNGNIRQCAESTMEGTIVHDLLRKRLIGIERKTTIDGEPDLNADDEDYDEFDDDCFNNNQLKGLPDTIQRTEFLFHLFSFLAIGGSICQHDFTLNQYLETTKEMYRKLVTVFRSASTNEVVISTAAFRLFGRPFFLNEHKLQRCYLLFERKANLATILHLNRANYW